MIKIYIYIYHTSISIIDFTNFSIMKEKSLLNFEVLPQSVDCNNLKS